MIKCRGQCADGKHLYILGLSRKNTEMLLAGRPIDVDLSEIGGQGHVLLMAGETEDQMVDLLAGLAKQQGVPVNVEEGGFE